MATTYDEDFTHTDLGKWLRGRVWQRLEKLFQPGRHVFEIGCGTGEDALWLAQHGIHVLATDVSQQMLQHTQQKAASDGLEAFIQTRFFDLNALQPFSETFDGAFSNFGPLNCTRDWDHVAVFLAKHIRRGGKVGLGVMSPFCIWEIFWHSLHLDFATAFRRLNRQSTAHLPDGSQLKVFYPSIRQLTYIFESHGFRRQHVSGIGVFLPPSDAFRVVEKRPGVARLLMRLEVALAHRWPFRTWADHYWIEFLRR
jgi:SAM-dependent methyltransferase